MNHECLSITNGISDVHREIISYSYNLMRHLNYDCLRTYFKANKCTVGHNGFPKPKITLKKNTKPMKNKYRHLSAINKMSVKKDTH